MEQSRCKQAWESVSETYAEQRDPDGSDAALIDDMLDHCPSDPTVVDIGCGDGARTLANLPAGSVGVDFARAGLSMAAETVPDAGLLQGEMTTLPITDDIADGLTAYHAVFHVPREQHPAVYREFARVLQSGGMLLCTLPGGRFETTRRGWMGGSMFFSAPGRDQTLSQLETAGFEVVETPTATDPLGSNTEFVLAEYTE
jgi:Methylase involved in ubiquinone/menaquinone biosynthesis